MKKIIFFIKILILCFFVNLNVFADTSSFFNEGELLFKKRDFTNAKIFFERDLVFNPKSEKSYLYLAKIFNNKENEEEEEMNLNSTLLLNPQNDEAIYMLTILKIKQSDYQKAEELINKFDLVCKSFCSKKDEIKNKFEKLIPKNAKTNNTEN